MKKIIEIIREEDFKYYGFKELKDYDILNLQNINFKAGFLNLFKKNDTNVYFIQKPHNYKIGMIINEMELIKQGKILVNP